MTLEDDDKSTRDQGRHLEGPPLMSEVLCDSCVTLRAVRGERAPLPRPAVGCCLALKPGFQHTCDECNLDGCELAPLRAPEEQR